MPNLSPQGFWTNENPESWKYTHMGTAAGTTTISNIPAIFHGLVVNAKTVSGQAATIMIYDSAGTSANLIGTIILGTSTAIDNIPPFIYNAQCINGLTVSNSANIDLTVLSLP